MKTGHGLSEEKRPNRSMTLEQLKFQIQTTLETTKMFFKTGEQRVLAVLFLLLLAPAGARPASILKFRFNDITVSLRRDPKGGPHKLCIDVRMRFKKRYKGDKVVYVCLRALPGTDR